MAYYQFLLVDTAKMMRSLQRQCISRLSISTNCLYIRLLIRPSVRPSVYLSVRLFFRSCDLKTRFLKRRKFIHARAALYGSWIEAYHTILDIRREWRWKDWDRRVELFLHPLYLPKIFINSVMSRDYDRRRGGSGSSSSKLRMDTSVSQTRPHGESSSKRRELDTVMRKARESQSSYWNKKLLEVEERDPNRWRHSGYKELYVGGTSSGEPSRSHPRSPRSPRPRSPHSPRPRSPRARSPRSPRERSHTRGRAARSPSTGSTCSDRSCSVCSPKERRRIAPPSRSRSRSITPVRARAHPKEVVPSSSRALPPRTRPRSPPLPRPRTPPPAPQPPPRHQKDYKALKEKEAKVRRKEKHHSRLPEDPRVPDPLPLMRKPVKVEKTHSSHGAPPMMRQPPDSSPSEDSDSSSTASHVGPPRMTLSERFGKMAQWSVDRRDMENMRITKDGENAMKVVIEGEERIARLGYESPPPGHYPESLLAQGPRGLECWDDVRVRYDYYKARGYLRDLTLDDYIKWEEWWYKYQEWLEAERFYEQWASSNRSSGGGRKRRGRRNNAAH